MDLMRKNKKYIPFSNMFDYNTPVVFLERESEKKMKKLLKQIVLGLILIFAISLLQEREAWAEEYEPNYLTFTAVDDSVTIQINYGSASNLMFSYDGISWSEADNGTSIKLSKPGDKVLLKANGLKTNFNNYFMMKGNGKVAASGSVTSLTDGNGGNKDVVLSDSCYWCMFADCKQLISAPELPATNLTDKCYESMFFNCTSLKNVPQLPATELKFSCYSDMFKNCTSLENAPELPSENLAENCYSGMFSGCKSLVNAPELPARNLIGNCYSQMFVNCTSLVTAPELPAEELTQACYQYMFSGCTSLKTAPELPAVKLGEECYDSMFEKCSSLEKLPELPASELKKDCYKSMFSECTNLLISTSESKPLGITKKVTLPESNLAEQLGNPFDNMFKNAGQLKDIPTESRVPASPSKEGAIYYILNDKYSISYELNGGTQAEGNPTEYIYTVGIESFKNPTRSGFSFAGWFEDEKLNNEVKGINDEKQGNVTLYAKWLPVYEINYELNGGTQAEGNPTEYIYTQGITSFGEPTRIGYTFAGWYSDDKFSKEVSSIGTEQEGDVTLYAKWEMVFYSISYELNGGTQAEGNPTEYSYIEGIKSFKNPTRSGYTFAGWYSDEEFKEEVKEISAETEGEITLYAKWLPAYKVIYVLNGGTQAEGNPTEYTEGEGIKSFKTPTRIGYAFVGWYSDEEFKEEVKEITAESKGDITLYAKWEELSYKITYELNGGTQAEGNPTGYAYTVGVKSFKAPTRSGYTFAGWFEDAAFTREIKEISGDRKGDITLYAKWIKDPYTQKITVKNVTYVLSFDSNDNATNVVLSKFSDKKATSASISKVKYIGKSYNVTEIGDNAFKNNKKLKTVTIGSSVKIIGKAAFSGCTALTTVKSGSKVTEIKASAFSGCKKLKSITLASTLKTIGSSAFTNCKALTKVTLGSKVNSIGSKAFKGCSALKSVTIKTTLLTDKNVGKEAFSGINSKATVKVPAKKLKDYTKLLKKKGIKGKNQKIKK